MKPCTRRREVERWIRQGALSEMPSAVQSHIEECSACAASVEEVTETRAWFDDDVPFALSDTSASEMRFRLEAAARESRLEPNTSRISPYGYAAFAAFAAAAVALLVLRPWVSISPTDKHAPTPLAQVSAEPGVAIEESKAPHEAYRLENGTAQFDVRSLQEGESFTVRVGDEAVHVRGTSYQVEAEDGRLMAVRVREGVVEVALDGVPNPILEAGESWERPIEDSVEPTTQVLIPHIEPRVEPRVDPAPRSPSFDALFRRAWSLHQSAHSAAAAAAFDRLLRHPDIGAREPDVLFWSAQSHFARGNEARARAHLQRLVTRYPSSNRAPDARRQLSNTD